MTVRKEATRLRQRVLTLLRIDPEQLLGKLGFGSERRSMCRINPPVFRHRRNPHGAFYSACPACFDVISTRVHETDLVTDEAKHSCNELILNDTLNYFRSHLVVEGRSSRR
jgi:hypothetical protein